MILIHRRILQGLRLAVWPADADFADACRLAESEVNGVRMLGLIGVAGNDLGNVSALVRFGANGRADRRNARLSRDKLKPNPMMAGI